MWASVVLSDPLLAGLPRDPDYCVSHFCLHPSLSVTCWPDNEQEQGSSSEKALDCMTHFSRSLESEGVSTASEQAARRSVGWSAEWDSEPQPHEGPACPNSDQHKEHCHDQDLVRRSHNPAKCLEPCSSKVKVKNNMLIPDSQKLLRCELDSLRSQLQAQTKAFEFLNHSVTMLEKESCLQQIKIQQLEEALRPLSRQGEKGSCKWSKEQCRQQDLYGVLAQGLQGLQKTMKEGEELQQARTTRCLQLLAQEIRDSKKFLWEELELVREEVTFIYQKLQAQEDEISENLLHIQKMQKTQVKCRKVLTKMKQQVYEPSPWPESEEVLAEGSGCWREELQKELRDIWSAVHSLQNSIDSLALSMGTSPRASSVRGRKGQQCMSSQWPSWDSDSDWERPFSKIGSYAPA
ncbi:coiled-coil domain-containing protein 159 isoform X2 [Meriones unguiculatus]|uniref:coiled-coil domain-containing protein 159 isoform X2 n=1 Tax=Meriones unguiculatus TaxID=10047 RepID=UPI00293F59DE|nr:coiled-coil domain-containing protein 159 isoform X2 [Meriones unguiculatus]